MTPTSSLTNHFLIAMPNLADPNFSQSVTYICEHNDAGALGLVLNRPTEIRFRDILEHMKIQSGNPALEQVVVYHGGPVQPEQGFVLHAPVGQWEGTLKITGTIGLTTSRDILTALAEGRGPEKFLIALGYAGWGAGQLEAEMVQNAWLSVPADLDAIMSVPVEQRWARAAALLGIDLKTLSPDVGHA